VTPDEIRAVMEDPVAQRLLNSQNPARLAYAAKNGTPRVVPVGFHWDGATIVIGTVPGSAKVTALEANPAVALTIDTSPPAWPPKVLLVRGTASVSIVDGVFPEYVAGARKLTPAEEFGNWEAGVRSLYDQMARIDITPTWAKIHDFRNPDSRSGRGGRQGKVRWPLAVPGRLVQASASAADRAVSFPGPYPAPTSAGRWSTERQPPGRPGA